MVQSDFENRVDVGRKLLKIDEFCMNTGSNTNPVIVGDGCQNRYG